MNNLAHRPTSKSPRARAITDPCDRLREAIVSGEFQPNERLVEADLSVRLGVGRTAIRAALTVLDQEGLIIREPNRGARVRLISAREALEIEQVRNSLERLLTRSAAGRASDTDLADLRAIVSTMAERLRESDSLGYSQLNGHLHRRIWRIADNQVAIKVLVTLKSQSIRFQYGTMLRPGRPEQSLREHEAIVAAIAAHDPEACDAAMAEHLGHVLETLQWAIEAQDSQHPWSALREPVLKARSEEAANR